jgi:hypothetical protein
VPQLQSRFRIPACRQREFSTGAQRRGHDRGNDDARSGHALFARDDMPEVAAYDVAKAIDAHREALKCFIRPYSYDSRTVWKNLGVPLHPGAERYYREAGYLPAPKAGGQEPSLGGGCAVGGRTGQPLRALVAALALLLAWRQRRRTDGIET